MARWTHTYREQAIPGANSSGVITAHKPGQKLAKAVTEIQERAIVDVSLELDGLEDNGTDIFDNTLYLKLVALPGIPEGGTQYQVLQRNADGEAVWDYVRAVEVT